MGGAMKTWTPQSVKTNLGYNNVFLLLFLRTKNDLEFWRGGRQGNQNMNSPPSKNKFRLQQYFFFAIISYS
jgi:hypothetical protein